MELLRSSGSGALRLRRKHILGGGEVPRRRWEQSLQAEEFIWPKRVQRVRAVLACFETEEAEEKPSSTLLVASRSLASVAQSSASLAEPTLRAPGRSRLTCQAAGHGPISSGRSTAAAMFPALRCQSVWQRPIGCRAGGQVTAG